MRLHRDNDEERAAVVDQLLQEHRRQQAGEPGKASVRNPVDGERRVQSERRRGRSDVEWRTQRKALERRWNEQRRRQKRSKAS